MNTHKLSKVLYIILVTAVLGLVLAACTSKPPSAAVIEKAKAHTLSIIDSLRMDGQVIIGDVNQESEFFDENSVKYVINYTIETGIDSANMITTEATAFVDKQEDGWSYRFVFDETYQRSLE